ncbi:type I-B CRISPR-associated protein Cas7/Cst2/DevR [Alienimonas sp. DA493]|uniref:type I-B CRISPR-associated protein Cas7/Cst2/DevR n=1 Tax=Alienimonas sp. DA493 TaxID=3373605 RepID=UPI003754A8D3
MTTHLFATLLTARAVAANNRAENDGNATTLQKVIRGGRIHSTVSSEAIRYALREVWHAEDAESVNRRPAGAGFEFADKEFKKPGEFIDTDVLGFMHAKKETLNRRAPLEVCRAVSLAPWPGTISHNFASPGSNPAVKAKDPIPYAAEVHDTRYQYSVALTPGSLLKDAAGRTERTLRGLQNLRRVAGNHARYLYDFSPEAVVLRVTPDPAPRMLLCFEEDEHGHLSLAPLLARTAGEEPDVEPGELIVGTALPVARLEDLEAAGASVHSGVKAAFSEAIRRAAEGLEADATATKGAK